MSTDDHIRSCLTRDTQAQLFIDNIVGPYAVERRLWSFISTLMLELIRQIKQQLQLEIACLALREACSRVSLTGPFVDMRQISSGCHNFQCVWIVSELLRLSTCLAPSA